MTDFMFYLSTATALVFVVEGLFYFLFPDNMKKIMETAINLPSSALRMAGLGSITIGIILVWLIRIFAG